VRHSGACVFTLTHVPACARRRGAGDGDFVATLSLSDFIAIFVHFHSLGDASGALALGSLREWLSLDAARRAARGAGGGGGGGGARPVAQVDPLATVADAARVLHAAAVSDVVVIARDVGQLLAVGVLDRRALARLVSEDALLRLPPRDVPVHAAGIGTFGGLVVAPADAPLIAVLGAMDASGVCAVPLVDAAGVCVRAHARCYCHVLGMRQCVVAA
jgi:CBS domain-containing protein